MVYLPAEKPGGLALNIDLRQATIQPASYTNLPEPAVKLLLSQLQEQLQEQKRNNYNLNDLLDKYRKDVVEWESKYQDALAQNAADLKQRPNDHYWKQSTKLWRLAS